MGNCRSGESKNRNNHRRHHDNDAFVDDDVSHSPPPVVVSFEPLNNGRNNHHHHHNHHHNHHHDDDDGRHHHHVQSLYRVGETILRRSRTNPSIVRPHKASTYDHVHDLVQGIEGDPSISTVFSGMVGLANLGNTCFVNASLQCLSNTIPLTDYFLGYDYRSEINADNPLGTGGRLVSSYAELIKHLWLGDDRSYLPARFKSDLGRFAPQFEGHGQHDAHELLAYLLDGMHEDLNRVRVRPPYDPTDEDDECDGTNDHGDAIAAWSRYLSRNQSIVVDLFQGQLRNTMTCRNRRRRSSSSSGDDDDDDGEYCCGHVSVKFDPFMYLSLPVSDGCDTLDDCLDIFCSEEFLTGDERWYCPRCMTRVDATKKIDLFMLPPILIVHLKRFEICPNSCRWTKIDRAVRYPLNDWNLNESTKGGGGDDGGVYPLYDLYAISHHVGDVGHGHYTSHARNRFDGAWYNFNDGRCDRIINDPTMRTEVRRPGGRGFGGSSSSSLPSAYCLFYHRVERVRGANGGDDVEKKTVIRRQSVSRPELWPHLQRAKAAEWASLRVTT